jgi:hypothetical protein
MGLTESLQLFEPKYSAKVDRLVSEHLKLSESLKSLDYPSLECWTHGLHDDLCLVTDEGRNRGKKETTDCWTTGSSAANDSYVSATPVEHKGIISFLKDSLTCHH